MRQQESLLMRHKYSSSWGVSCHPQFALDRWRRAFPTLGLVMDFSDNAKVERPPRVDTLVRHLSYNTVACIRPSQQNVPLAPPECASLVSCQDGTLSFWRLAYHWRCSGTLVCWQRGFSSRSVCVSVNGGLSPDVLCWYGVVTSSGRNALFARSQLG